MEHEVIAIEIANVGHQPVVIQGIASDSGKKKGGTGHLLTCRHIPKRLEVKDYLVESATDFGFIGAGVKRIYAWDSEGHEWELPRKNFDRIRETAIQKGLLKASAGRRFRRNENGR